jgi:hypothetical protein
VDIKMSIKFIEVGHREADNEDEVEFRKRFDSVVGGKIDKDFYSKVVGVSFRNSDGTSRQDFVKKLKQFQLLELALNTAPEYPDSVAVVAKEGAMLGYLDERCGGEISRDVRHNRKVWCAVVRSVGKGDGAKFFGAVICLFRLTDEYVNTHQRPDAEKQSFSIRNRS